MGCSQGSCSKENENVLSIRKVVTGAFWGAHGVIFTDFLEKDKMITEQYYEFLLDSLSEEIKKKTTIFDEKGFFN